jgi:hypothetical protein
VVVVKRAQRLELGPDPMLREPVSGDQRDDVHRVLDSGERGFGIAGHRGLLKSSSQARVLGNHGAPGRGASRRSGGRIAVPIRAIVPRKIYPLGIFSQVFRGFFADNPNLVRWHAFSI